MNNTATMIYEELIRRGVPVDIIDSKSDLMRYKKGDQWHILKGCLTENASYVSIAICDNKSVAEKFARKIGLPVPDSVRYEDERQAMDFINKHKAIVLKPLSAAHGHGVTVGIRSRTALREALALAKKYSPKPPILQEVVRGQDIRLLIIGGKYVAAVRRVPATIKGDGKHTIQELIDIENAKQYRVDGNDGKPKGPGQLKRISLLSAKKFLNRRIRKVPKLGEEIPVVGVSNTSLGGHAEDITDLMPKSIYQKAEEFAELLKLPVCGVDVMMESEAVYYFLEANAQPGFGPHQHPRFGEGRDITGLYVDYLLGGR